MKIHHTLLILTLCAFQLKAQTKPEILTNETVTMLVQKGLGASIIINKIKTSKTNFDVSTDALIKLKEESVPDEIVAVMVEYSGNKGNVVTDPNDPLTNHSSGIYYYNPNDEQNRLNRIDPTVVSSNKSGGVGTAIAQHFTYGLAKNKQTAIVSGSNARKQITGNTLTFYFYFDKSKGSLNNSANWWFASATSPNEFALIKLEGKKDSREFNTGESNAYGSSIGISEKQKITFDYTEVGEGIYKVTLRGDIPASEYCFIYTGAVPSMYNNDKIFDFGIF
jgi:hypothetical protein